jgi:serine/threonine-protein kinase HipA
LQGAAPLKETKMAAAKGMKKDREILVYADWESLGGPVKMGTLTAIAAKGKEVFSFEYDEAWLQSGFYFMLDPDLHLYSGRYFPTNEKQNFGLFLDSCPDRWGRVLMDRREAIQAKKEDRSPRRLIESDYLLGVFDEHRPGAIRFKTEAAGEFLNNSLQMTTPPWTSLRELEYACRLMEEEHATPADFDTWFNMLVAPASSLGGARPKASVLDPEGQLWIAKFPSTGDVNNIGGWEFVVHQLAKKAGLNVADGVAKKLSNKHHTYISKRFDRVNGKRLHFASALTMLGYVDGDGHDTGVSYLEIAEFLMKHGSQTDSDLEELWRRIVFSTCVKNTDDHLRNHGFLLMPDGWRLSPAYDINANAFGEGLSLNISEQDNSLSIELAMSVAEYFRVKKTSADKIVAKVQKAVGSWRKEAKALGIPLVEQARMASAFS